MSTGAVSGTLHAHPEICKRTQMLVARAFFILGWDADRPMPGAAAPWRKPYTCLLYTSPSPRD
eukprot:13083252-Alexandrium_andersonii.AAC.1